MTFLSQAPPSLVADPTIPASATQTDFELAVSAGRGNMSAFEKLYQRHHRRVYSICLKMMRNHAEAEDLTQDVFIQLHRKVVSFKGKSAFTTWLHSLTVNQVRMYYRKRRVKLEKTTDDGTLPDRITTGSANPDRMQITDKLALDDAINQLPDGYRNVFVLHDVEGFDHYEVSRILGCSIGTSKSQLHKARIKLRKLIQLQANPRIAWYQA